MGHFNIENHLKNFLFKGLDVDSTWGLVGTCFIVGFITFLLEGAKMLMLYWLARIKQHPLTYGQTDNDDSDGRDLLISSLMIPASLDQIRSRRLKYHVLGLVTHAFNVFMGYIIMLAVMTYNVWITVGVILGSGIGYFIFGAANNFVQAKYANLGDPTEPSNNYQINSAFESANESNEHEQHM